MTSDPNDLSDGEQLALLRRLAKIYAFSFDQEQPCICEIRFMDACVAYWTLCEIDTLEQLSLVSPHVGFALYVTSNLYSSNNGFMGKELINLSVCNQYVGLSKWLGTISGQCRGSGWAAFPTEPQIAEWIECRGDPDLRRGLIEDGGAGEHNLYITICRPDLTIRQVAPEWPISPTMLGVCGYFEALLYYESWYARQDGDIGTWRTVPLELRFDDVLSWLNIKRPKGLVDEPVGWRTGQI